MGPISQLIQIISPPPLSGGLRILFRCSAVMALAAWGLSSVTLAFMLIYCITRMNAQVTSEYDPGETPNYSWIYLASVASAAFSVFGIISDLSIVNAAYADALLLVSMWSLALFERAIGGFEDRSAE